MNKILKTLKKVERFTTLEDCLPVLNSSELSDADLRGVVNAKFEDIGNLTEAYKIYGDRLIDPSFKNAIDAVIRSGYSGPIVIGRGERAA